MSQHNTSLAEKRTEADISVVEREAKENAGKKVTSEKKPGTKKKAVSEKGSDTDQRTGAGKRADTEKKPVSKKKTMAKKKPESGKKFEIEKKTESGKKAGAEKHPAARKRTETEKQDVTGKKPGTKKKAPAEKQTEFEKKSDSKKRTAVEKKPASEKRPRTEEPEDFEERMKKRDAQRARRREERMRKVRRQKIIMAVSSCVIVAVVIGVVVLCLPSVKLAMSLSKGDRFSAKADYVNAQSAYEKALEIDVTSVKAYRSMADNYVAQQKIIEAEEILYTGWEETKDEGLLHYYCTELHNEAVGEINAGNCTLATVDKCIQVLEKEPANEDTLSLFEVCYERLFGVTEDADTCMMFYDEDAAQDTCSYAEYEQLLRRMLVLYQTSPSEEIKGILRKYALIDMPYVRISVPHAEQYAALLAEINTVVGDADITETMECLKRAKEVEDYFAKAFTEFEAGNYAYARELVAEESYQKIRDDFINEDSGYWEGSIYIPVSREQLVLHREEGKVRFSFLDGEAYDNRHGIIKVWGTKQEDDGVQRSVISYEPVAEQGTDSDTEYTIQYLYSNVKINGQYVPQMNYRFDTKITTEEGITTNAIGDWGGEHEWEIDY